ncbi:MAG: hypothetical protein HY890_09065, partial [Deltaproteobacteria bacterium]|nr:hypothetical protein [Deltaproteobacteria bacterium]
KKLAELKLPLITHPGSEFALPVVDRSLGEPSFLRPALDCGVRVIFAHGLSSGVFFHERYFNTAKELIKTYPNLFLDASALTLPTRMRMLLKIRDNPEIKERLLFGSDYPLPAFSSLLRPFMRRSGYPEVKAEGNYFDRLVLIFRALGIDFSISLQDKLIDKPVG